MWPTFVSLDGLRSLDVIGNRYGRLPHELIADFPTNDPYVVYCFNEAVAIAGMSQYMVTASSDAEQPSTPATGATMEFVEGAPVLRGKVPIVRKKAP
jgi:hypothetical protein